jgi:hypothetical protein
MGKKRAVAVLKSNKVKILHNIIFQEINLCLIGLLSILNRHYFGTMLIFAHDALTQCSLKAGPNPALTQNININLNLNKTLAIKLTLTLAIPLTSYSPTHSPRLTLFFFFFFT